MRIFRASLCWRHGKTRLPAVRRHRMEDRRRVRKKKKTKARFLGEAHRRAPNETQAGLGRALRLHRQATAPREPWRAPASRAATNTVTSTISIPTSTKPAANPAAWNRSLAQAKLVVEAFARDYPAGTETGLLLMGPCGAGKTHLAVAALRQIVLRGHTGLFYDSRTAQGNSGQLQSGKSDDRAGSPRAGARQRMSSCWMIWAPASLLPGRSKPSGTSSIPGTTSGGSPC